MKTYLQFGYSPRQRKISVFYFKVFFLSTNDLFEFSNLQYLSFYRKAIILKLTMKCDLINSFSLFITIIISLFLIKLSSQVLVLVSMLYM
jgi:hypothetical protein